MSRYTSNITHHVLINPNPNNMMGMNQKLPTDTPGIRTHSNRMEMNAPKKIKIRPERVGKSASKGKVSDFIKQSLVP